MSPASRCRPGPSSGIRLRVSPEVVEVDVASPIPAQVIAFELLGSFGLGPQHLVRVELSRLLQGSGREVELDPLCFWLMSLT